MRLQLSDNNTAFIPLASKQTRKAKRQAKTEVKLKRIEGKKLRKVNRQESKTKRQATGQLRKQTRKEVGVEKQQKRMIRVVGKQELIKAKQKEKLNKVKQGSFEPDYQKEQDQIPNEVYDNINGGSYFPEGQEIESDDLDYQVPEVEEVENENYQFLPSDEDETQEPFEELGQGFLPALITGAGKLISNVVQSKAGQVVEKGLNVVQENQRLKVVNADLKSQVNNYKTQRLIFGAGGVATGFLIAYLIKR